MTIRLAKSDDLDVIKKGAHDAYAFYVERIGKKPAPVVADFDSQIEAGIVYVSTDEQDNIQGFIVFTRYRIMYILRTLQFLINIRAWGLAGN